MGVTGTEVAKDAAGMVLTDDNFATIVQAVKNGRNVYANIKRAIQFLLSGNAAGILTVLYASLMGLPVPFAAVHLLFINLLTDSLPAIALGLEPHTDAVMQEKPRPRSEGILTRSFLTSVVTEGLVIAAATIAAFHLGLSQGGAALGSTMAFATLCLSRLFHGFNCKSSRPVLLTRQFWNNKFLLGAFAAGAVLLGAVLLVPALETLVQAAPLTWPLLGAIVGLSFSTLLVIQLIKAIRNPQPDEEVRHLPHKKKRPFCQNRMAAFLYSLEPPQALQKPRLLRLGPGAELPHDDVADHLTRPAWRCRPGSPDPAARWPGSHPPYP